MLNSPIEWTDHSWNPWVGCTRLSEGCRYCYMERWAKRAGRDPWTVQRTSKATWDQAKRFKPGDKVFVCSLSDFFHHAVPDEWREDAVNVMDSRRDVVWILLTKRHEEMFAWSENLEPWLEFRPNIWGMVTVENQEMADLRTPYILQSHFAVKGISIEPMLSLVDIRRYLMLTDDNGGRAHFEEYGWGFDEWSGGAFGRGDSCYDPQPGLDWVICGGESGSKARPMHPDWVRSVRDQCQSAGVPFHFKQWGEWIHAGMVEYETQFRQQILNSTIMCRVGKKKSGRMLDGKIHDEFPGVIHG